MLTLAEIDTIVTALEPRVVGGQIQKVRQPDADTLVLRVRVPGRTTRLVISARPGHSRLAESPGPVTTLPTPTALGAWMRSAAGGRRLSALQRRAGDRIVELSLAEGTLVAELTGRHANLFALDPTGRVVAMAHRDRGTRGLQPGMTYAPPPPPPARDDPPPRFTDPVALEEAARARIAAQAEVDEATQRKRLLGRARKRLERLHRKVSADVGRAARAEALRKRGELLKGALHTVRKGDTTAEVTDWYAEGTPTVQIELDPTLEPAENLQRIFARYKKAIAGAHKAGARLEQVEAQQYRVEELAEEAPDELPLAELEQTLIAEGLLPPRQAPPGRKRAEARLPYRLFESARGERILVGRGGADNHATTFGAARGNDHWLHARDVAGAHVIVPLPARNQEPHQETLLDAAALAVHHSKLRGEPGVEVMITRRKHVRAIRGAGPGRVTVAGARSLVVTDQDARITRLYRRG